METEYKIGKIVPKFERVPRGYGIAWVRYDMAEAVCFPIPFNALIAIIYKALCWIKMDIRPQTQKGREAEAYNKGHEIGYREGYKEGYQCGERDTAQDAIETFGKRILGKE